MYVFFSRQPVNYFHIKGSLAVLPQTSNKNILRERSDGLEIWKDMPKAHIVKFRAQETQSEGGSGWRNVGFKFTKLYIYIYILNLNAILVIYLYI